MTIRNDHPRIWVTADTLPALKAKAVAANDRWVKVLQAANVAADWNTGILTYSLAFLVTEKSDYAARAWSLMTDSMKAGVNQISPDSFYQCRNYFVAAPIVYDWLNPWLSAVQKSQLQADIEACADAVWPETSPSRSSGWAVSDSLNNYFYGFMLTWIAGISLYGDSTKAQGYIDNARAKYNSLVLSAMLGPMAGGVTPEGTGYGSVSVMELLQSTLAHQTATGEDLIGTNPWFSDVVSAMIHLTNPPMTEVAPFGDLAAGPVNDTHRRVMLMMAGHDSRCKGWLDGCTPNVCTQRINAYADYLWYPS